MGSIGIIVIYVVALGLMMYFLAIKPQKKQQKAQQQLMDSIEIGDYVLTTMHDRNRCHVRSVSPCRRKPLHR